VCLVLIIAAIQQSFKYHALFLSVVRIDVANRTQCEQRFDLVRFGATH
jgi:hypothetical protein